MMKHLKHAMLASEVNSPAQNSQSTEHYYVTVKGQIIRFN